MDEFNNRESASHQKFFDNLDYGDRLGSHHPWFQHERNTVIPPFTGGI